MLMLLTFDMSPCDLAGLNCSIPDKAVIRKNTELRLRPFTVNLNRL